MDYDLITIGGEIAGATLGRALTSHGARVLIVERESRFRDRVRGETVRPWGVAEARALGIADLLLDTCGQEVRWWRSSAVGVPGMLERDLIATPRARGRTHLPPSRDAGNAPARGGGGRGRGLARGDGGQPRAR